MKKIWSYFIPALLLATILAFQSFYSYEVASLRIEDFRVGIFDFYQKIKPRVFRTTPVRIIDIDDESLAKLGQWPWPRPLIAKLITRLAEAGSKVIAFDIVFAEPDRTSPKNIAQLWPENTLSQTLKVQMDQLQDHDLLFAEAISKTRSITAFGLTAEENLNKPVLKENFAEGQGRPGDKAANYIPMYKGAIVNLPEIEKAASGNGVIAMDSEREDTIHRVPLIYRLGESLYPSLTAEAIRIYQNARTYKIKLGGGSGEISFGEKTGIVSLQIGKIIVPTDDNGRLWLYDTGHRNERFIPAWKILSGEFDPKQIEGAILFIGTSATGLKDLRATPLNPHAPGVEVHAQIAEQILLQDFLERPDWASGAEWIYLFILGLLLILFLPRAGAVRCAIIGILAVGLAIGFSWIAFSRYQLLMEPVFPSLAILSIYLVSSFMNFLRTEKERSQIRGAFSRYLSPALVERLAKDPKQLKLGGETKIMTFLFTDIRNFTSIAEEFTAQELTQFMNQFMTPMTEIILKHHGTIDKYMGDCIMAFWNAPLEDPKHSRHACEAALAMQKFIEEWNVLREEESKAKNKPFRRVQIGIGINTGQASVGNMGSEYRFDYTVLGDDVNLASRLEGLSKNYGVTIVLGQNTAQEIPDMALLELDLIRVKGKTKPVQTFTLLGHSELKQKTLFTELSEPHHQMMKAYFEKKWDAAEKYAEDCRKRIKPEMKLEDLYRLYTARIRSYKTHPPASDWDGVAIADSK